MIRFCTALLTSAVAAFSLSAAAQENYPNKPIRVVIGYSAGGGNDIIVRVMTPELSKGLGQPVIVDNKPGAQSIIAAEHVAKQPADGYTILMGPSGPMTINPATYSKLPYDPVRDFTPISMICSFPLLLVVDPKLPVKNVKELIAYAKANPGKSNYASSAGIFQVASEMLKQRTGTNIEMITYKSSGESAQAVISGQVMMTLIDPPPVSGPLKSGTLRGLAVTSAKRSSALPDVPTMAEAGVSGQESETMQGILVPAGTPKEIVDLLNREIVKAMALPDVKEKCAQLGFDPIANKPDEFAAYIKKEVEKWGKVIKDAKIPQI